MKRQIRRCVFETNSSSVHSIVISKEPVKVGKSVRFGIGEFGWRNDCVDIVDYLYTAILEQGNSDELLEKLKGKLDKHSIKYEFEEPSYTISSNGEGKWLDFGYIDHGYDTIDFINAVLSDDDMLMRCLFGNSCVYTGNDNQDAEPAGCNIASEYTWGFESGKYVEKTNPYHDPEHYDYFYKGN